jgi:hypothetical protein
MKKLFFLLICIYSCKPIDNNINIEVDISMEAIMHKYAKDSLDIRAIVGDSFAIYCNNISHIRKGMCAIELSNIKRPKDINEDKRNYIAIIDIHGKKLKGIYYFEDGFQHVTMDYYRDTLYMAEMWDCFSVRYLDTKTNKTDVTMIDPYCSGTGVGTLTKINNNLFLTSKPYRAGIIDWTTKHCIESSRLSGSSPTSSSFIDPINNDINLIDYSDDSLSRRYLYAYDKLGKKRWQFMASKYIQFMGYKNYFIGIINYNNLVVLDNMAGKTVKSINVNEELDNGNWKLMYIENNIAYLSKDMIRLENNGIRDEIGNTQIKAVDILKGKVLWSREIKGQHLTQHLDNLFITNEYNKDTKKLIKYLVYAKNDFNLISEYTYQKKITYSNNIEGKWKGDKSYIFIDRETNKHYLKFQNMLYW